MSDRNTRKHLRELIRVVEHVIKAIDMEMTQFAEPGHGSRMSRITNSLELAKDIAKRFGLTSKAKHTKGKAKQ